MKKISLVTHHRPHIDDICGIWMLARFYPPAKGAKTAFVSSSERDPGAPDRFWIGVGRGRFDEHKGDLGESAASLVLAFVLAERPDLPAADREALERLVVWVRDEDMGLHDKGEDRELGFSSLLRSHFDLHGHDSTTLLAFGMELLDDAFAGYRNAGTLADDWQRRVEFESPWGRAVGVETAAYGADDYAYRQGFTLLVLLNPRRGFRGFRAAARSTVDLSDAYEALRRADPKAEWFLHHSRKLLLCGSDVAPDTRLSKLTLQDLIRVLQPIPR